MPPSASTPEPERMSVDDVKRLLVAWRRQQRRLEQSLLLAAKRLLQCPAGDHAGAEFLDSSDALILQHLRAVLEGDTWRGSSCGENWVRDWLKWGEPFSIEDASECGKIIGGKSEQKRRDNWQWYFGAAPFMEPIVASDVIPAKTPCNRSLLPHPSTPAQPPAPLPSTPAQSPAPLPFVSVRPSSPVGPSSSQAGGETSNDAGGVWEFENSSRWNRFPPEQSTRLEDAWKHNKDVVVFNAGFEFEFEVDMVAMHQTMIASGAVWKVRRQVSQVVPGEDSRPLQAGATPESPSDLHAPFPDEGLLDACKPALPEPDRDEVLFGLGRSEIPPDADLAAVPSADACRPMLPEPERDQVLAALSRHNADDALTINTLGSADSIPVGTDLAADFYRNLWAARLVSDPTARLVVQCNRGMRVIDAENVGFSYGEALGKGKKWDCEGVRRAVRHFLQEGLHVILVTPRRQLKDMTEDKVDVIFAESSNSTDDVQVLKQAHAHNCPWVSRDGAKDWKKDFRLSSELRTWVQEYSFLQVRWSWGPRGEFVPDFDLPTPALRPANRPDVPQCSWCKKDDRGDGEWQQQWCGNWHWTCRECSQRWAQQAQ